MTPSISLIISMAGSCSSTALLKLSEEEADFKLLDEPAMFAEIGIVLHTLEGY
jgi:hypothetical protein